MNHILFSEKFSPKKFFEIVWSNNYFLLGMAVKLLLSFFFASPYLTELFIPFLKTAVTTDFWSVYKQYIHINPAAFPYPPVMLYVMALPSYLASLVNPVAIEISSLDIFLARLPLLVADMVITLVLIKWLRSIDRVLKWYWLNPVVIYICYIHGQLDIIPTAFLCLALYSLFTDRRWTFVIFLALACATKFHVIITIPLLIVYLIKTKKASPSYLFKIGLAFTVLLLLFNTPFILQSEYFIMVYRNEEQGKVLVSALSIFHQYHILLIPAGYLVLLYLMIAFNFINRDILLIFLALSFGLITFFIVPSQGWYMWNVPFLIYFIIRFQFKASNTFVILNVAYFLFFIIYPKSDIPVVAQFINTRWGHADNLYTYLMQHGVDAELLVQLAFTFLQTSLLLSCVSIFRIGVLKTRGQKIYHHPYLIGICGDSGTGKSTLSASLKQLFGQVNTLVVHGDDMHRWERGHEKWSELTHLNPQANWLHSDLAQLIDLKAGKKVYRQHYDHDTGRFTKKNPIYPNKIIIYEGLHAFYLRGTSKIYDLKIFLKPSEALRRYWKVKRDVQSRGYSSEKVLEAIEKRMGDSLSHVLNQETNADIIFSVENTQNVDPEQTEESDLAMVLRITCANDIYFERLLDALRSKIGLKITHNIDHVKQEITLEGQVEAPIIREVAFCLGLDLEDLTGINPIWSDDYLGLMQIFLLYQVNTQLKREGMYVKMNEL